MEHYPNEGLKLDTSFTRDMVWPLFITRFHNSWSSLNFHGAHTSCSYLIWLSFSISIIHNSKTELELLKMKTSFYCFQNIKTKLQWQFQNFAHLHGPHLYVLSKSKIEVHMHSNGSIIVHTPDLCFFLHFSLVLFYFSFTFLNSFILVWSFISFENLKKSPSLLHP